jgi:hypothetical protein
MIPQRCQDTLSKFGVGNVFALRMYRDRNANTINLNLYSLKEANTQGSALFISARRDGSLSVRNHEDEFLELVSDNPYAELFTLIFDDFRKAVWASFIQEKIKEIEEARYKRRTSISALTSHPYRAVRSIIFDQIKGEKDEQAKQELLNQLGITLPEDMPVSHVMVEFCLLTKEETYGQFPLTPAINIYGTQKWPVQEEGVPLLVSIRPFGLDAFPNRKRITISNQVRTKPEEEYGIMDFWKGLLVIGKDKLS